MKRRNQVPVDEARLINASGQQSIHSLGSRELERHLDNIYLFKLGLKNSFGIDFRTSSRISKGSKKSTSVLFNYISELLPLLENRVQSLPPLQRRAYRGYADAAVESFWEIYYRFQPLIHKYAKRFDVEVDDLGNVLGRAILLYDKKRGFKFYSYLEKTLRESVKNLRGRMLAEEYSLPLSVGRLLPQLFWLLDQETLRAGRRLTAYESDDVTLHFLREHTAQFSEATMRKTAQVARTRLPVVSWDNLQHDHESPVPKAEPRLSAAASIPDDIEAQDQYEYALQEIYRAIELAGFDETEQAILLEGMDLAHDENLFARIESEISAGSFRERRKRLLVRFTAAYYAPQSANFGRFALAEPQASRLILRTAIDQWISQNDVSLDSWIQSMLNVMSLNESVYRLTISERGRLESFLNDLCGEDASSTDSKDRDCRVDGQLFNKFRAALIDQDRQGFPCCRAN